MSAGVDSTLEDQSMTMAIIESRKAVALLEQSLRIQGTKQTIRCNKIKKPSMRGQVPGQQVDQELALDWQRKSLAVSIFVKIHKHCFADVDPSTVGPDELIRLLPARPRLSS